MATVEKTHPQRTSLVRSLASAAHYDFCPWANKWVYWLKRPLPCLVLAAVTSISCGYFVNPQALVAAIAISGVVFLGVFWPAITLRGLGCNVTFEKWRGREGRPVRVKVRIRNRFPWPAWGLSLHRGFAAIAVGETSTAGGLALAKVPGWSTSEFTWEFVPPSRGEYPLETPQLETAFPFGLWRGRRPVDVEGRLLVWPSTIELAAIPESADLCPSEDTFSEHRVGDSGDLMGTRLFRDGDSLRRVHWAQTARHDRLIYCERQAATQSAAEVILDADASIHRGTGPDSSLEWAIRITASICESLQAFDAHAECTIGGERIAVGRGQHGMRRLLDKLARLPRAGLPGPVQTPGCGCHRAHQRLMQIVVTTDVREVQPAGHAHRPDNRTVVLRTAGFTEAGSSESRGLTAVRPWIEIKSARDASACFSDVWKKVCHAG